MADTTSKKLMDYHPYIDAEHVVSRWVTVTFAIPFAYVQPSEPFFLHACKVEKCSRYSKLSGGTIPFRHCFAFCI